VELRGQLDLDRLQAVERKKIEGDLRTMEQEQALQEKLAEARREEVEREQTKHDVEEAMYYKGLLDANQAKKQNATAGPGVVCNRCGAESPAGSRFCKTCGERIV